MKLSDRASRHRAQRERLDTRAIEDERAKAQKKLKGVECQRRGGAVEVTWTAWQGHGQAVYDAIHYAVEVARVSAEHGRQAHRCVGASGCKAWDCDRV